MLPTHRTLTHPGKILLREFLEPKGTDQASFAARLRVPASAVADLIAGRSGVTPELAVALARELGTSTEFWLNLQIQYDATAARA